MNFISGLNKLYEFKSCILGKFSNSVLNSGVDEIRHELRFEFKNAMKLFIRFNDYGKYAYQFQFSMRIRDRVRYDNYDDRWPVSTRPHHYHPRYKEEAIESKMNGDPKHDCLLFIKDLEMHIDLNLENDE